MIFQKLQNLNVPQTLKSWLKSCVFSLGSVDIDRKSTPAKICSQCHYKSEFDTDYSIQFISVYSYTCMKAMVTESHHW